MVGESGSRYVFSSDCRKSSSSEALIGGKKGPLSEVLNGQGHVLR
jgi:hypothetical protein